MQQRANSYTEKILYMLDCLEAQLMQLEDRADLLRNCTSTEEEEDPDA